MKAIAVDDEPIALEIIRSHASKVPFLELKAVFTNAFQALDYLQKEQVDLIFLDIKMPDISGLEFFNSLPKKTVAHFYDRLFGTCCYQFRNGCRGLPVEAFFPGKIYQRV